MKNSCFQCGNDGSDLYGYIVCDSCKSKLRLFTDEKIQQHLLKKPHYKKEISNRLEIGRKDYISKKIKLLHIQDRLNKHR